MSRAQLYDLLFNRVTKGNQRNPYEEKAYSGPDYHKVREMDKVNGGCGTTKTNVRRTGPTPSWEGTLKGPPEGEKFPVIAPD